MGGGIFVVCLLPIPFSTVCCLLCFSWCFVLVFSLYFVVLVGCWSVWDGLLGGFGVSLVCAFFAKCVLLCARAVSGAFTTLHVLVGLPDSGRQRGVIDVSELSDASSDEDRGRF
jgi:hypothetical protein